MNQIISCRGFTPSLGKDIYIAPGAYLIGDVVCGDECSFWFNSVTRGDVNSIRMGKRVNVQDGAIIHCTYERSQTIIGDDVSIGHNAIVHGCEVEQGVLIGMGSIVMDDAIVGAHSIVAAGAVVLEGTRIEAGSIYAGVPAKRVKQSDIEEMRARLNPTSQKYVEYSKWFQ